MYLIPIIAKPSSIDGNGVFAMNAVPEGTIVWKFDPTHDCVMSVDDYNKSSQDIRDELYHVAYLSKATHRYVYPPKGDPARFTNHSTHNNLTAMTDTNISEEPYFVANRDIAAGEEITNNYIEFEDAYTETQPSWIDNK